MGVDAFNVYQQISLSESPEDQRVSNIVVFGDKIGRLKVEVCSLSSNAVFSPCCLSYPFPVMSADALWKMLCGPCPMPCPLRSKIQINVRDSAAGGGKRGVRSAHRFPFRPCCL